MIHCMILIDSTPYERNDYNVDHIVLPLIPLSDGRLQTISGHYAPPKSSRRNRLLNAFKRALCIVLTSMIRRANTAIRHAQTFLDRLQPDISNANAGAGNIPGR